MEAAADEATAAEDAELAESLADVTGTPGWVGDDIAATLRAALVHVEGAMSAVQGTIDAAMAPIEQAVTTAEAGLDLAMAPMRLVTGTIGHASAAISGFAGRGAAMLGTPELALSLVRSRLRFGFGSWSGRGTGAVPSVLSGGGVSVPLRATMAKQTLDAGLSAWSRPTDAAPVDVSGLTGTTPARQAAEQGKAAVTQATRRAALVEAARAAPHVEWPSADGARASRDRLADALDGAILDAPDRLYGPLVKLRAAVIRAIDTRAAALPALATWTPAETEPALVTAARLYGDRPIDVLAAAEELASRNGIVHPLFVPGGQPLEVLR